ncbi:MAG TPA: SPFH domain-containing protein [Chloroflexota bacterium]|nr:SPFH domain-containing protein [Chloroflexota bacterium]
MTATAVIAALLVVAIILILAMLASIFRKVGPNQALVIYGFGGTHIVQGGGRVIWPMVQTARELSLELMSFDGSPQQDLYTNQGVAVNVEAVAQIKVRSDPESIRTAAEQFLTKDQDHREVADLLTRLQEVQQSHPQPPAPRADDRPPANG